MERAKLFDWRDTARKTLAVYEKQQLEINAVKVFDLCASQFLELAGYQPAMEASKPSPSIFPPDWLAVDMTSQFTDARTMFHLASWNIRACDLKCCQPSVTNILTLSYTPSCHPFMQCFVDLMPY